MKRIAICSFLLISFALNLSAQIKTPTETLIIPDDFVSDGCSRFPDGDYRECCVVHDVKYYYGGSRQERSQADNELRKCVAAKPGFGHKPLSIMMWFGVRAFGVSWLPTSFRWGFGKNKKPNTAK